MARFTQYTQAATCVCVGRGYTVEAGDFKACDNCEAGEAFAVELAAIKAKSAAVAAEFTDENQAPELAPVVAGPAVPVRTRKSARFPQLTLEIVGERLTFRLGMGYITYAITGGELTVLESRDKGYLMPSERAHIVATARAYAEKAVA